MSEIPELTTRDVLQQIDRRLTLIEEDQRQLHSTMEKGFVELRTELKGDNLLLRQEFKNELGSTRREFKSELGATRQEFKNDLAGTRQEFGTFRHEMDTRLRWLTGIVLASWLSIMSALLLK